MVATPAGATASEQLARASLAKTRGETGCRRAGAPRQDAGPLTASVPTGCWSFRAGPSASPGSWRGRWDRGPGPGGVRTLCPSMDDSLSLFLCSASLPLRGSSFLVAAAAALCRCTRIPRTRNLRRCLVSRVTPARLLGFLEPGGWSTRGSKERLSRRFLRPGGAASGRPLLVGSGSAPRLSPVLPAQPSPP